MNTCKAVTELWWQQKAFLDEAYNSKRLSMLFQSKVFPCNFKCVRILQLSYASSKQRPFSLLYIDFHLQILWNYTSASKKKLYVEVNTQLTCVFNISFCSSPVSCYVVLFYFELILK